MFCSVARTVMATLSLALCTTLGMPGLAIAQSDRPAPASPATGGSTLESAPNFSAAGITTKVVSISKAGSQIALALMFQNTNPYAVRSALVTNSFTVVDNKGQFMRTTAVSGMQSCGVGRSLEQVINSCVDPKNPKDSAYLEIEAGASVIVNMSLGGNALGDTVTLAGMLVIFPLAAETGPGAKPSPGEGKAINISIPLIPLQ